MTKKKGIIIAIVIFIIILSLAISIYMPNKEKIKEDSTTDAYYLLKREEKYGVINTNGDIIIEPQYDKIVIPNQHKALFICNNENSRKILNDKNEEILTNLSSYCILKYRYISQKISDQNIKQVVFYLVGVS